MCDGETKEKLCYGCEKNGEIHVGFSGEKVSFVVSQNEKLESLQSSCVYIEKWKIVKLT